MVPLQAWEFGSKVFGFHEDDFNMFLYREQGEYGLPATGREIPDVNDIFDNEDISDITTDCDVAVESDSEDDHSIIGGWI